MGHRLDASVFCETVYGETNMYGKEMHDSQQQTKPNFGLSAHGCA